MLVVSLMHGQALFHAAIKCSTVPMLPSAVRMMVWLHKTNCCCPIWFYTHGIPRHNDKGDFILFEWILIKASHAGTTNNI